MSLHEPALIRLRLCEYLDRTDEIADRAGVLRHRLIDLRDQLRLETEMLARDLAGDTLLQLPDGTIVIDHAYPESMRCRHVDGDGPCRASVLGRRIDDLGHDPADLPPVAWHWLSADDYHRVVQRRCRAHFDSSLPLSLPEHWTLLWAPDL